jgi:putative phage-type endonuclease
MVDVVTKLKNGKYSAARDKYLMEKVVERLTGRAAENYVSPAMEWGIDTEPLARAAYEEEMDVQVEPGNLFYHPKIEWYCASPDGLVSDDGLIEIKCPTTSVHLETICQNEIPEEYLPQMAAQMSCSERKYCDYVSFDPRVPANLQLFIKRYPRPNDEAMALMEQEVQGFLDSVVLKLAELAQRVGGV